MKRSRALIGAVLASFCFCADSLAGGVNIAPTRAVIDRSQSASFTIYNDDPSNPVTYRISLVNQVMAPDGSLRQVGENDPLPDGLKSARAYLKVAPSQIRLDPGQSQSVRIAFRPPADLPAGEYRSHLMVAALPKVDSTSVSEGPGLNIKLNSIFSVVVPVIVRIGSVSAEPILQNARFETSADRGPVLSVDLARRGDASVFGDVAVFYSPSPSDKAQEVGRLRRVAAYPEVASRSIVVALKRPSGGFAPNGRLVARFYADLDAKGPHLSEVEAAIR